MQQSYRTWNFEEFMNFIEACVKKGLTFEAHRENKDNNQGQYIVELTGGF